MLLCFGLPGQLLGGNVLITLCTAFYVKVQKFQGPVCKGLYFQLVLVHLIYMGSLFNRKEH